MAGGSSDRVHREVHRLFNSGAVGTISDAHLLTQFASRRDEAAQAAFEELMIRHGPMVLRVCRSVLHDAHDAEDAFQAVFIVLANRSGSIRQSASVATWLFGVAQRVANRGKRSAARRQALNLLVAERTSDSYFPTENDPDWEILHEEIKGLPEGLRAPIVLNSMLLYRVSVATILLCLGIAGSYWAWHAVAATVDGKAQTNPGAAVVRAPATTQPPRTDRYGDPLPPGAAMRLGTVRFRQFPYICHVVYSPDGQLIATDTEEGYLQVWDPRDGRKLRRIDVGLYQTRDFAFSPDGKRIAAAGFGFEPERNRWWCQLNLIDVEKGQQVRRGEWDPTSIRKVAYAPDGMTIATRSDDGTLQLWDVAAEKLLHRERLGDQRNSSSSIAFSPNAASHLLAIASDRVIHLWDAARLRDARTIAVEGEHPPTGLAFSPDGTTLAAGIKTVARDTIVAGGIKTVGAEIRLWRVRDGTLVRCFKSPKSTSVYQVYFSPDGKFLAATGFQGPPVLFDAVNGKELDSFEKELDLLDVAWAHDTSMAFSPEGRTLATLGGRQALHFWDWPRARTAWPLPKPI
jgi:RNA polymerase sigma factor (sigma-70 family)